MKTVSFMKYRSAGSQINPNVLHVEVPGAIVNITIGLHDADGRDMTHVSVQCDQGWQIHGDVAADHVGVRVRGPVSS